MVFGPVVEESTADWRKLHNDDLHDLFSLPNTITIKSRKLRWGGGEERERENKNTYRVLVATTEETTWKPRHRWESNIQMEHKKKNRGQGRGLYSSTHDMGGFL